MALAAAVAEAAPAKRFTLEQVMSAPSPSSLTAAPKGGAIAWVLDQQGARNIWVAEAPAYKGRGLTNYRADDGQEIDQITWTPDGRSLIFVRGGDFEMHRDNPNPASLPQGVEQDIWIIPLAGGSPRKLAEGNSPAISPKGDRLAFLNKGEVWSIRLDENAQPEQMFHAKGQADELRWSPDGSRLAFSTNRSDHAFIAVYNVDQPSLTYLNRASTATPTRSGPPTAGKSHSCVPPPPPAPSLSARFAPPSPGPFISPMPPREKAASFGAPPEAPAAPSTK